tara:strand:+ start:1143 stop:1376 length:234 start_codon:yes stop_codon:yes gene_type:complete
MKTESTKEILTELTLHITRISGDIEHIKDKVNDNNKHLEKINGRLRSAENSITAMKSIGSTLTFIIGVILTWLGVQE